MKTNKWIKMGVLMTVMVCPALVHAGGDGWVSDFKAAQEQAAESKEDLLVDFTGSDWCGWCIKLNEEVFSHEPFKEGVKDKFVLVEIDFPKDKTKLSEETVKQNAELGEKYGVRGYPTILLCDSEGRPYASTGYQQGGPEAYVAHLDTLREKKVKRDASFAAAEKLEGAEQAKELAAALKAMDLNDVIIGNFYADVIAKIKAADPDDESGFQNAAKMKAKVAKYESNLRNLAMARDMDGALEFVNTTLAEGGFGPDETQQMIMTKASILAQQKQFDAALKAVDEATAAAPDSDAMPKIAEFKKRVEAMEAATVKEGEPAAAE